MSIDTQLAELLGRNAQLYAAYEEWANGQIMLLAGTVDDPDSFDSEGGKTGALGYYPLVNVSGQTIYAPCLARLRAIAREVPETRIIAADAVAAPGDHILADTAAGPITLALPADGGSVIVDDAQGTWGGNPLTIAGNGRMIDGVATFAADASGFRLTFTSVGSVWRFTSTYQYGA